MLQNVKSDGCEIMLKHLGLFLAVLTGTYVAPCYRASGLRVCVQNATISLKYLFNKAGHLQSVSEHLNYEYSRETGM